MQRVIIESPYAGDVGANIDYGRRCLADSLARNEAPLASHLLYTQGGVLDDHNTEQRAQGIAAGHSWYAHAHLCVVYIDFGISPGMRAGIGRAKHFNVPVTYREFINETGPASEVQLTSHGS